MRPHWIVRAHNRYQHVPDAFVLAVVIFCAGFVAGLAVMGAF